MVYLKQANVYKILIPRHNMDFAHILHIFFLRINPQEIVCASVEREEMIKKKERNVREKRKVGGSCESELERICNIAVIT